jgi:hypothetical protein
MTARERDRRSSRAGRSLRAELPLEETCHKRLLAYALAASATGVGVLATTPPARAEIVYTPANTKLTNGPLFIDLNHDGINDFVLSDYPSFVKDRRLAGRGLAPQNGLLGYPSGSSYPALALKFGAGIGRRSAFWRYPGLMANVAATFGTVVSGPWANVSDRFLGLKFDINGQTHYGWARLSVKAGVRGGSSGITALLLGYAYETVPNKPIHAGQTGPNFDTSAPTPEPGTLGALALGSEGLAYWRKKKEGPSARN